MAVEDWVDFAAKGCEEEIERAGVLTGTVGVGFGADESIEKLGVLPWGHGGF